MILSRRSLVLNRPVSRAMHVRTKAISPEILNIITEYVCPIAKNCKDMYIGTESHQMGVLNRINILMDTYDISHGEGYVLRALFLDNVDLAIELAKSFNNYNLGVEIVRETIQKLPDVTTVPHI